VGRRGHADPRWILPLLCRRGHITRQEVGAIRVGVAETLFQVPRAIAARFEAAVRRTAQGGDADDVRIARAPGPPPQQPRGQGRVAPPKR